jgi:hypothetical protein
LRKTASKQQLSSKKQEINKKQKQEINKKQKQETKTRNKKGRIQSFLFQ